MIRLWRINWFERTPPIEQVDFGNGQLISAEDVLEGHFQKLKARTEQGYETTHSSPNELHETIDHIAPKLTALTDLAEEVAETVPDALPTLHFRATLNQALTETHRQHSAQRTLGIRPTQTDARTWTNPLILALVLVILTMGVASYGQWLNQMEQKQ